MVAQLGDLGLIKQRYFYPSEDLEVWEISFGKLLSMWFSGSLEWLRNKG